MGEAVGSEANSGQTASVGEVSGLLNSPRRGYALRATGRTEQADGLNVRQNPQSRTGSDGTPPRGET